jgi:hypothetical protein
MSENTAPPRDRETDGKLRQFHRLLMSYIDFQQAAAISGYLLEHDLYAEHPQANRLLVQALNCAAIVCYCRPFSGNDPGDELRIPDLPGRFLRVLTPEERQVHDVVMDDRNTALAHSDADAWQMDPHIIKVRGREIFVPMHHDVHSPLLPEAMRTLHGMCNKLREAVFEERRRFEQELRPFLRVVEYDDAELERHARALGVVVPGAQRER